MGDGIYEIAAEGQGCDVYADVGRRRDVGETEAKGQSGRNDLRAIADGLSNSHPTSLLLQWHPGHIRKYGGPPVDWAEVPGSLGCCISVAWTESVDSH